MSGTEQGPESVGRSQDDIIHIGNERYHLRDWTDQELLDLIAYRYADMKRAERDAYRASMVLEERYPEEPGELDNVQLEFWD